MSKRKPGRLIHRSEITEALRLIFMSNGKNIYRMILFSNDYRKHRVDRNVYSEEASRVADDGKSGGEKQGSDYMVIM